MDFGVLKAYSERLSRRIEYISSYPEFKMLKTFKDLFHCLGDPDTDNRLTAPLQARIVFQAVATAINQIVNTPSLKSLLTANKGRILAWIYYFYWSKTRWLTDPDYSDKDDQQAMIYSMSTTIYAIYTHEFVSLKDDGLPSIYEVISGLWIAEDTRHAMNRLPYASKILSVLFCANRPPPDAFLEALLRSANGDADKVAQIAITKLRSTMKEAPDDRWPIAMHFVIVAGLACGRRHDICVSLHEHEIFTTMSKCVRLLADLSDTRGTSEEHAFMFAFGTYVSVLTRMIAEDAENGTRALKQCIRYGALDSIERYLIICNEIVDDPFASPLEYTLSYLISSLGIRTVCLEAIDAFTRLPLSAFSFGTPEPKSPRRKLWQQFVTAVMSQSAFVRFAELSSSHKRPTRELCSYVSMSTFRHLTYLTPSLVQARVRRGCFTSMR